MGFCLTVIIKNNLFWHLVLKIQSKLDYTNRQPLYQSLHTSIACQPFQRFWHFCLKQNPENNNAWKLSKSAHRHAMISEIKPRFRGYRKVKMLRTSQHIDEANCNVMFCRDSTIITIQGYYWFHYSLLLIKKLCPSGETFVVKAIFTHTVYTISYSLFLVVVVVNSQCM